MDRRRSRGAARDEELPHVLPGATQQLGHVGEADDVRVHLDQGRFRKRAADIADGAQDGLTRGVREACEIQGHPADLADTDQCVITAGIAEALDQVVRDDIDRSEREAECEFVFSRRTLLTLRCRTCRPCTRRPSV